MLPDTRSLRSGLPVTALAVVVCVWSASRSLAQDRLKIAVGGRGIGETFVTEVGYNAGLFKKHNLVLDIFYTDGGGETQQAVISNSAQIGVASGFLGAIGVFAKGAPVRIVGGSYTGGSQLFFYVPAGFADQVAAGPRRQDRRVLQQRFVDPCERAGAAEALQGHLQADADRQCSRRLDGDHERAGRCRLGGRAVRRRRARGRQDPADHEVVRCAGIRQANHARHHRQCQ